MDKDKVLCLIDGEHYFPVTKGAIDKLESDGYDVELLLLIGGTEKVRDGNIDVISELFNKKVLMAEDTSDIPYELIEETIKDNDIKLVIVYCDNIPIPISDDYDLDKAIMDVVYDAVDTFNARK